MVCNSLTALCTVCRRAGRYGIPAVLGVGNGTKRIEHGQMITIDGDAGTVIIIDDDGPS
jgi:phosphohistidine swiveling domain-containing protein